MFECRCEHMSIYSKSSVQEQSFISSITTDLLVRTSAQVSDPPKAEQAVQRARVNRVSLSFQWWHRVVEPTAAGVIDCSPSPCSFLIGDER